MAEPAGRVRCHLLIDGRVQGVWFRESCRREAAAKGVAGWIRNRIDGRVEAVFEGSLAAVEAMVAWSRIGPPRAEVTGVDVIAEPPRGEAGFAVR